MGRPVGGAPADDGDHAEGHDDDDDLDGRSVKVLFVLAAGASKARLSAAMVISGQPSLRGADKFLRRDNREA